MEVKQKKPSALTTVLRKIYDLLDTKQKFKFLAIIIIMIVSAILTQLTPKAIGWLTDDILTKDSLSFDKVIPFLILILVVNLTNEVIKIIRRVMVEDVATSTEKRRAVWLSNPCSWRHFLSFARI